MQRKNTQALLGKLAVFNQLINLYILYLHEKFWIIFPKSGNPRFIVHFSITFVNFIMSRRQPCRFVCPRHYWSIPCWIVKSRVKFTCTLIHFSPLKDFSKIILDSSHSFSFSQYYKRKKPSCPVVPFVGLIYSSHEALNPQCSFCTWSLHFALLYICMFAPNREFFSILIQIYPHFYTNHSCWTSTYLSLWSTSYSLS